MIQYLESPMESSDIEGYFEALVEFGGRPTKVMFDADDSTVTDLEQPLAYLLTNTETALAIASKAIESELLPLYNNNWRCYSTGTGEEIERPEVSLAEFLATVSLDEIEVSGRWIELWYDDGDLFFGHAVKISIRHSIENGIVSLGAATTGLEG
jgi:hypothetical protein